MAIKIQSKLKELMTRKNFNISELIEKTGLPYIVIFSACSEKIEYCGLNVLSKIAVTMDVSIKDLFDEQILSKNKPVSKQMAEVETNISAVTEQLIGFIMKLSITEKVKLLERYTHSEKTFFYKSDISNVDTDLVDLIMTISLGEQCQLLSDFISYSGQTKRKFSRKKYFRPVPFTIKSRLYHGSTQNISVGGVFIEIKDAKNQFTVGDKIKMNLEHPKTYQHSNVTGTIVRIANAGLGVRFDEPL